MQFARNVLKQSIATVLVGGATFGLQVLLARNLGPEGYSVYGIAASVAGIAVILQDGGFRTLLYREATHPSIGLPNYQEITSHAFGWNVLWSILIIGVTIGSGAFFDPVAVSAVAILIATNLGRVVSLDVSALLRARGLFGHEASWQISNRLSVILAMILFATLTNDLLGTLLIGAVAQFANLIRPSALRLLQRPKFVVNYNLLIVCATLMAIDLVTALYFRSDVLIMAMFGVAKQEIGVYAALTRILEAYIFFTAPIAITFFRSARLEKRDGLASQRAVWRVALFISVPALILWGLTAFQSAWIINTIFGAQYESGVVYLPWLIGACFAAGPNAILGQELLAANRERYFLAAVLGALIINLLMNFVLIPVSGAAGAAQATCATEFGLLALLTLAVLASRGSSVSDTKSR